MKRILLFISGIISLPMLSYSQDYNFKLLKLKAHVSDVKSVRFSPDMKYAVAEAKDKTAKLLDLSTGDVLNTYQGHVGPIEDIRFNSDGSQIFTAGGRSVNIRKIDGSIVRTIGGHATFIWSFDFTPEFQRMVTGSFEKKIKVWDVATGKNIMNLQGHEANALAVAFGADGKYIASGSLDFTIRLWNSADGSLIKMFKGSAGNIFDIAFTPDGKYIISACDDGSLKIWDIQTGKSVRTLRGHAAAVTCMDLSTDGKTLISGSYDKTVNIWNLTDGKLIYSFDKHKGLINAVDLGSDDFSVISGASEGELMAWRIDKRVFVDAYYLDEFEQKMQTNSIFDPKRKGEKGSDYKLRQEKQQAVYDEMLETYFNRFLATQKANPIAPAKKAN